MAKRKSRGGNRKGRPFELEIAVRLSEWWSNDRRVDIYYHTHVSGARATVRAKTGRHTAGAYGDLMATDPIGQPLLDVMVFEAKRGYSSFTPYDAFDRRPGSAIQVWEGFLTQARDSQRQARSLGWAIIAKRDQRERVIALPMHLWAALLPPGDLAAVVPWLESRIMVREVSGPQVVHWAATELETFLEAVQPAAVRTLAETWRAQRDGR